MWEPEPRESDRYPKATLRQQAEDFVGWFPAHRNGTAAIAIVVGLAVLYRVLTPSVVGLDDLRAGDCLFVRTASAISPLDASPGAPASVRQAILSGGAEEASCDLSHSHEVSGLVDLDDHDDADAAGAPPAYDPVALLARAEDACAGQLPGYLGLPPGATSAAWVGFAVIPDERLWERGARVAACLVTSADGRFPTTPARDAGR